MKPYIISLIGYPQSGKTSLARALVQRLEIEGIKSGFLENNERIIPDDEHSHDGTGTTCEIFGESFTLKGTLDEIFDIKEFIRNHMPKHQVVFVEGFPYHALPRIEVIDNSRGKRKILSTAESGLFAFVLREPGIFAPSIYGDIPRISFEELDKLAEIIKEKLNFRKSPPTDGSAHILIRPPVPAERDIIVQMFLRMFEEEEYTASSIIPTHRNNIMSFFGDTEKKFGTDGQALIFSKGQIAGFIWILKTKHFVTGEEMGMVGSIYVMPRFRGNRLGQALMEWGETYCRKNGFSRMTLTVFEENTGARQLYDKLNFRTISVSMEKML